MFLHLTLQEFLAAYHVVNTEGEEKRVCVCVGVHAHIKGLWCAPVSGRGPSAIPE